MFVGASGLQSSCLRKGENHMSNFVTEFRTKSLNLNTLRNVAEVFNFHLPAEKQVTVVSSHADEKGTWGFAYAPDAETVKVIESSVQGLDYIVQHGNEVAELLEEGRLVEAYWHLCKATDMLIWQSEQFKSTQEWRRWQRLIAVYRKDFETELAKGTDADRAQVEKVKKSWLGWHFVSSPEKALAL